MARSRESERLLLELGHGLMTIFEAATGTLNDEDDDGSFELQMSDMVVRAETIVSKLKPEPCGRGSTKTGLLKLPYLSEPKSTLYTTYVTNEERFVELVRFTPAEFEALHTDVLNVLEMVRNSNHDYSDDANRLRKKRRYKYSSRERLFHFLFWFKNYGRFAATGTQVGLTKGALYLDVVWLREQLSIHPLLVAEVQWGTPEEREAERKLLVAAGLLTAGFEDCTFMCDGTKDLGRRIAHYNRTNEPDFSENKGNGKSHLLVCVRFEPRSYGL